MSYTNFMQVLINDHLLAQLLADMLGWRVEMGSAPSQQRNHVISVVFDSVNQRCPLESKTRVQRKILIKKYIKISYNIHTMLSFRRNHIPVVYH